MGFQLHTDDQVLRRVQVVDLESDTNEVKKNEKEQRVQKVHVWKSVSAEKYDSLCRTCTDDTLPCHGGVSLHNTQCAQVIKFLPEPCTEMDEKRRKKCATRYHTESCITISAHPLNRQRHNEGNSQGNRTGCARGCAKVNKRETTRQPLETNKKTNSIRPKIGPKMTPTTLGRN